MSPAWGCSSEPSYLPRYVLQSVSESKGMTSSHIRSASERCLPLPSPLPSLLPTHTTAILLSWHCLWPALDPGVTPGVPAHRGQVYFPTACSRPGHVTGLAHCNENTGDKRDSRKKIQGPALVCLPGDREVGTRRSLTGGTPILPSG